MLNGRIRTDPRDGYLDTPKTRRRKGEVLKSASCNGRRERERAKIGTKREGRENDLVQDVENEVAFF